MKSSSLVFYIKHPIHAAAKVVDKTYRFFHPEIPWITPQSVKQLEKILSGKNKIGLEWGSGKSTLWFSKFCKELHSIEYNHEWYKIVEEMLRNEEIKNTQLHFIELEHSRQMPTYPVYEKTPKYVSIIQSFPELYFDFIMIDGHYRQACVLASDKHLKTEGFLIIDNYNRVKSRQEWGVPPSYELIHLSSNIVTTTAIFRKK